MEFTAVRRAVAEQRRSGAARRAGDDAARRAGDDAERRFADWSGVYLGLIRFVEETRTFRGLPGGSGPSTSTVLQRNERAFLALRDAHVIEPRPTGGRFVGGSGGVWLRRPDGSRCQVGATGGLYVPGIDQPESVDVGALVVTDRRVHVGGCLDDHEWRFRDLSAVHHDPDAPWTALVTADRPGISGVFYGHADVPLVRFRLMLALAVHTGTVGRLRAELEAELTDHTTRKPPFP